MLFQLLAEYNAKNVSVEEVEAYFQLGDPREAQTIVKRTKFRDDSSCHRSILELCALKMTDSERTGLVGKQNDNLYEVLRRPKRRVRQYGKKEMFKYYNISVTRRAMKQRWFDLSESATLKVVDATFQIITSNPQAFCQMVGL